MSTELASEPLVTADEAPRRLSRFALRLNVSSTIGLALVVLAVLCAVIAPQVYRVNPLALGSFPLAPPSPVHPMGTDDLGRDVLSRVFYGAQVSLTIGVFSALIAVFVGSLVGALAGYFQGPVDDGLMRLTELFQVIPRFLLAIVVVALLGAGELKIILVIGLLSWPGTARIVRSQVLVLRNEEFVLGAIMSGARWPRILGRHVLPNVLPYIIVSGALQTGAAILIESFLSFLGLGDPSHPSWGLLLKQAQLYLSSAWWMATFPGVALALTILGLNLFGDGFGSAVAQRRRGA